MNMLSTSLNSTTSPFTASPKLCGPAFPVPPEEAGGGMPDLGMLTKILAMTLMNLWQQLGGQGETTMSSTPESSPTGLAARDYGVFPPVQNPYSGNQSWDGFGLEWLNLALESQGKALPELQAADPTGAYTQAQQNGSLSYGYPPPGAVVFFPGANGGRGHVGLVNPDGTSYRGTVPASENPLTIGDRPIPNLDFVSWLLP